MTIKYLIILCLICCIILTGWVIGKYTKTSQIKDYICTGDYNFDHSNFDPFTVDPQGNFYVTYDAGDDRMNIKKYNSQGKYVTQWIPEIIKRKKNCWFTEKKHHPVNEELTDIFADKEYVYIAYTGAYRIDFPEENFAKDYTSHIEQFDLNGKFITARKPKEDTFTMDYLRFITKDSNGNFYLAFYTHIEKYDANWNFQSILYPFEQKGYWRKDYPDSTTMDDLAVDSKGCIYIFMNTYGNNFCGTKGHIAKFDSAGNFIKERLPEDEDDDHLFCWGIEIDPDNNIFMLKIKKTFRIKENKTYRIEKFDSNLNFVTTWEFESGGDGSAENSNSVIKTNSAGNVYVDTGEFTIKKFAPKQ